MQNAPTITVDLEFSIGHRLMEYEGRCSSLHGHNYLLTFVIAGTLDHRGMVIDFGPLKRQLKALLDPFDHAMVLRHDDPVRFSLMEDPTTRLVLLSANPTAENLAALLFRIVGDGLEGRQTLLEVRVRETRDSLACAFYPPALISITEIHDAQRSIV